jgi:hypothetical protein
MLAFDSFPCREQAEDFASVVRREYGGRKTHIFDCQADIPLEVDVFPYELTAPIVLVERDLCNIDETFLVERSLQNRVRHYRGRFAGT